MRLVSLFVGAFVCLAVRSSLGATIVVAPGTDIDSIQEGVDLAFSGSIVKVKPGVYHEHVFVGPTHGNIKIVASGKVVIDARGPGGNAIGQAFLIDADHVSVKGFVIRHADSDVSSGQGIRAFGDGHRFENLRIEHSQLEGIRVEGNDALVRNCVLEGNSNGIRVVGHDAVIEKSTILNDGQAGIRVDGNGALIRKNSIRNIEDGFGIDLTGDDGVIESNVVRATELEGIGVSGQSAVVRKNKVTFVNRAFGIYVDGNGGNVASNTVEQTFAGCIVAFGTGSVVESNTVRSSGEDTIGINVAGPSSLVRKNKVSDAPSHGIYASGPQIDIRENQVRRSGFEGEAGIFAKGASVEILDNQVDDCGSGILISETSSALVDANVVRRSLIDGVKIEVSNPGATVHANVVRDCRGEGVDNRAPNAVITDNVLKNNRIDIANAAAGVICTGNSMQSGGAFTPPEID